MTGFLIHNTFYNSFARAVTVTPSVNLITRFRHMNSLILFNRLNKEEIEWAYDWFFYRLYKWVKYLSYFPLFIKLSSMYRPEILSQRFFLSWKAALFRENNFETPPFPRSLPLISMKVVTTFSDPNYYIPFGALSILPPNVFPKFRWYSYTPNTSTLMFFYEWTYGFFFYINLK